MNTNLRRALLGTSLALALTQPAWAEAPESTDLDNGVKLDLRQGMRVYKSHCAECHATGKNGAPRLRDRNAWKQRGMQPFSVLEKHAERGFLGMPPKGSHAQLSQQDVANAVYYMSDQIADRRGR
jgi:cytochrome c5